LEGGPADGDNATTERTPPPLLWVEWCDGHGEWHWYSEQIPGTERYTRVECNLRALNARYVYEDAQLGPTVGHDTRKREPVIA
jgi:hypothetical protein